MPRNGAEDSPANTLLLIWAIEDARPLYSHQQVKNDCNSHGWFNGFRVNPEIRVKADGQSGSFSSGQIKGMIKSGSLALTDIYFDDETAEWLPLSELLKTVAAQTKSKKDAVLCYCGSGLKFRDCHGM